MLVRIRDTEGCVPDENFIWDSLWINRLDAGGGYADWVMAGSDDPAEQRGGLRARMALHTSIMLCLFTDRRLPAEMTPPDNTGDPHGWWGDSVHIEGEPDEPMGSLLWTLARATLDDETARAAKDYAEDALQVLLDQGAVARFEVEATAEQAAGRLTLLVRAFDRNGEILFDRRFDQLWNELINPAPMHAMGWRGNV